MKDREEFRPSEEDPEDVDGLRWFISCFDVSQIFAIVVRAQNCKDA